MNNSTALFIIQESSVQATINWLVLEIKDQGQKPPSPLFSQNHKTYILYLFFVAKNIHLHSSVDNGGEWKNITQSIGLLCK